MTDAKLTDRLIQIKAETPLMMGDQSGVSNYQETADFIPGAALRGATATHLLAHCTRPDFLDDHASCPDRENCPFWQLFGEQEPLFTHAYPGGFGPVWPYPLTARTCKCYPGWPITEDDKKKKHGVVDILLTDFAYNLISDPYFPARSQLQPQLKQTWSVWLPDIPRRQEMCGYDGTCNAGLRPAIGYYAWKDQVYPADSPLVSRATHVGINRARAVAEDALLFTQESVDTADTKLLFFARVIAPHHQLSLLDEALSGSHYIGRGRSRGLGQVTISSMNSQGVYLSVAERLEQFQETIPAVLKPYREQDPRIVKELPGYLFSLTLRSPAILAQAGLPLRFPPARMLGLPDGVLELRAWARMEQVGGWDSAARLPRRTQLAVRAGSAFLYFAPNSVPKDQLITALQNLEMTGIGLERERGYGEVTVCATFHVEKARLL